MYSSKIPLVNSITFRLIFTYIATLCFFAITVYSYIFILNPNLLVDYIMEEQFENISENTTLNSSGTLTFNFSTASKMWVYEILSNDIYFQILDKKNRTIISSLEVKQYHGTSEHHEPGLNKSEFFTVSRPLSNKLNDFTIKIYTSKRLIEIFELTNIEPITKVVFLVILTTFIIISSIILITIKYTLIPLTEISKHSAQISPSNLEKRLPTSGLPNEIRPLVFTFNSILDRLEAGFKSQQELLSTTAHELKTPLSIIRGEVELAPSISNELKTILIQDIDLLARQIQQILHLAEAQETLNYKFKYEQVSELIAEVINFISRIAKKKNIKIIFIEKEPVQLLVDKGMFFTLMKNLLENAINHSPFNSEVTILLNKEYLTVEDSGTGIESCNLPYIFNKFWRAPNRQISGAGLGLSICQKITSAHNWKLHAYNQLGACFHISFKI